MTSPTPSTTRAGSAPNKPLSEGGSFTVMDGRVWYGRLCLHHPAEMNLLTYLRRDDSDAPAWVQAMNASLADQLEAAITEANRMEIAA